MHAFCFACAKPIFLVMTMMAPLPRPSLVSMATSMEITFDHSFHIRSFLLGSHGVASSLEASPDFIIHSNWHAKLGPFFTSSFDCNFQTKNNQTFIVCAKHTLVLYRKGLCGFLVLGFALEQKLHGAKCCKYFRPEGVLGIHPGFHHQRDGQKEWMMHGQVQ